MFAAWKPPGANQSTPTRAQNECPDEDQAHTSLEHSSNMAMLLKCMKLVLTSHLRRELDKRDCDHFV